MNKSQALGMFVFGGSAIFGLEKAGYQVKDILEISDDMIKQNSYHFIKNRPDITVRSRTNWEMHLARHGVSLNEEYKEYDLLYSNAPCSGLSQINKNACCDNDTNKYIYEVFDIVMKIKPKALLLENAPGLATTGKPILRDIVAKIGEDYFITVIRDKAGNHGVPMHRLRTLIVALRRDCHSGALIPVPEYKNTSVIDCLKDMNIEDFAVAHKPEYIDKFLFMSKEGESIRTTIAKTSSEELLQEIKENDVNAYNDIDRIKNKISNKQSFWDKSSYLPNFYAPSLTSISKYIHPTRQRLFGVKDYSALMGYPKDFEFYEESKVPHVQAIAQGVPANFIEYIATEILSSGNRMYDKDNHLFINQSNPKKITRMSLEDYLTEK